MRSNSKHTAIDIELERYIHLSLTKELATENYVKHMNCYLEVSKFNDEILRY